MQILEPTPSEAAAGIRAVAMVARAPGHIAAPVRNVMAAAQRHILHTDFDIDALEPIAPDELAAAVIRPEMRAQLVNAMLVASFADGKPPPAQAECVERFAAALGVATPALSALRHLAHHDMTLYALCVVRNGHLPDAIRDQYRHHGGLRGVAKGILTLRGMAEEPELAARYHALERLADDRLGKHVWSHYRRHGFAFPGEKGGFPEAGVYHDFSHVLAGYDTTPEGETLVGSFTAGYRERRPDHGLFTLLFVLSIFSVGVDLTPIDVGARTGTVGRVAAPMIEAIRRGGAMSTDLSDNWNHWAWIDVPLEEARQRLGIAAQREHGPGRAD
jgi:hypothetical protein